MPLNQKGVIHIFAILILLIGIIAGVYFINHPQIFKSRANDQAVVTITNNLGVSSQDKISDPNIYLLLQLPKDWQLDNQQTEKFNLLERMNKTVYAQGNCPLSDPQNHSNQEFIDNCNLSELAQLSNETLINFPAYILATLANDRLEKFSNSDLIKIGQGSGDLIGFLNKFSNDRLLNPEFPNNILNQLPDTRKKTFPCNIQTDLGISCAQQSLPPLPQPSLSPELPANTTMHIVKSLLIENNDSDGSNGGHEIINVTSNLREYFNKQITWKLNDLKPDQDEATRTVKVTLSDGINSYPFTAIITLTNTKTSFLPDLPQITRRLFGSTDQLISFNQYDNPPPLMAPNSLGAEKLLTDSGAAAGYSVKLTQTVDDITIDFKPQDLTEDAAKDFLNNADKYYLRAIMWMLEKPVGGGKIQGIQIDPWYAFCNHLSQDILDEVGATPTEFMDGHKLSCSDPPLTDEDKDKLYFNDGHRHLLYKKIPATILVKMIETLRLEREKRGFLGNAQDFATDAIPVVGPIIVALQDPSADPSEVANKTMINEILTLIAPEASPIIRQWGKTLLGTIASRIGANSAVISFGEYMAPLTRDLIPAISRKLQNGQTIVISLIREAAEKRIISQVLKSYNLAEDTILYRVTSPEYVKDGFAIANQRSSAMIRDPYNLIDNPNIAAAAQEGIDMSKFLEPKIPREIVASKLEYPSLNVMHGDPSGYAYPDYIKIGIRLKDILDQGGKVYRDISSNSSNPTFIITIPKGSVRIVPD